MDSGIITDHGLITDPIEQIRLFMHPPATPSFEVICGTIFDMLADMYASWLRWADYDLHNTIPQGQRHDKVAELDKELEHQGLASIPAAPWIKLIVRPVGFDGQRAQEGRKPPASATTTAPEPLARDEQYPDHFYEADLKTINASGQWVEFCIFLATVGFPCDDRFIEVISTLAKWFAFYEFYTPEIDRVRTKEVLKLFCLRKHNGFITRLNNGQEEDVLAHVDRVVNNAIDSTTEEGLKHFAEMRATRDRGYYPTIYRLEDLCTNTSSFPHFFMSYSMWDIKRRENRQLDLCGG